MEAAFALPLLALLVALVAQPAIILYDRMVMSNAAAEGCRLLQTLTGDDADAGFEAYVERRLGSVPPIPAFHLHDPCSWRIEHEGGEGSEYVQVSITNRLRPLPLMRLEAMGFGSIDDEGFLNLTVEVRTRARASWVEGTPGQWISGWE